ncbi:LysR family transcriptional regulator [Cochlodiniinecator piscidefendens]|uniref:LysR family transcriptional regulator n=1 Tax=Cochlodiniinecator piscidefendens TaxID=2715756 RepID=UPI00140A8229|nr:LysR family transcriptional regulator [Cochlodiniinecator piscidefendens]
MLAPRRYLPSIHWLSAFEAVARTGSVSQAADELSLTQSAVSRQIQHLETQVGTPLFAREKKRLRLTPAGQDYAREVRGALTKIANATLNLRANPGGGTLELAILPAFGTHWLAPRLANFMTQSPGVTVNLSTRVVPFDFDQERFHAAIHFGTNDWPATDALKLMDERVVPVVSPALLEKHPVNHPKDLLNLPLLHLETRPKAWTRWMAEHDIPYQRSEGMVFDQFATMARAAVHGVGAALLPDYLIERDLADGQLVVATGTPVTSIGAYYLVWPNDTASHPPLIALRDWLQRECAP